MNFVAGLFFREPPIWVIYAGARQIGSWFPQMSHEKRAPGWLGYIGDEILPSYIGIIINVWEGSLLTNQDSMESRRVFFVAQMGMKSQKKIEAT